MNVARKPSPRKRLVGVSLIVASCLMVGIAILMPRYRSEIATVDGFHHWLSASAPARREIVWQPAQSIASLTDFPYPMDPSKRPRFAENGDVVYFAMKGDQGDFDIFYSRRMDREWLEPQKVLGVNSPGNDEGPVLNQEGDRLYFHSDRQGCFGGTDLYVSTRNGTQWSHPTNLGPTVNTPADECDVSLSKDETQLIFASNRGKSAWNPRRDQWSVELPGDWRNHSFDLYQCDRQEKKQTWNLARSLDAYNTPRYDEITPCLSSDGIFLLFASDRSSSLDAPRNFDLFRGRTTRPNLPAERFGPEINSLHHEFAPLISESGFELQFSRTVPTQSTGSNNVSPGPFLQSLSKEVERSSRWDRSRLDAFLEKMGWVATSFFDRFAWIVLFVAAALALRWITRQLSTRKLAIPGFLMLALLLHALLISGSFFVFFQQSITRRFKQLFEEEPVIATQVLIEPSVDALEQPRFEQVARLSAPSPIQFADIAPQTLPTWQPQPIELAIPVQTQSITRHSVKPSGELIVASLPTPSNVNETVKNLARSVPRRVNLTESFELEATIPVDGQSMEPIASENLDIERKIDTALSIKVDILSAIPKTVSDPRHNEVNELLDPVARDLQEPIHRSPLNLTRQQSDALLQPSVSASLAISESISEAKSPAMEMVSTKVTEVERTVRAAPLVPKSDPLTPPSATRAATKLTSPLLLEASIVEAKIISEKEKTPIDVARARLEALKPVAVDDIQPESIEMSQQTDPPNVAPMQGVADVTRKTLHEAKVTQMSAGKVPPINRSSPKLTPTEALKPSSATKPQRPTHTSTASATPFTRKNSNAPTYADASITLQSLLLRRKLDDETKLEVVREFGGNDQTLATIKRGLSWMERHQAMDGHWGLHDFNEQCKDHERCTGHGSTRSDTAATALALLPFLGDGHTHQQGQYKDAVARGITWLIQQQKPDGNLFAGTDSIAMMYSHGIASIALCECYGMTSDPSLREPSQRAIDFIVAAQDPNTGGWRYQPRNGADTSVVGWQIMALKSAQMAGLTVPEKTLKEAQRWLESVAGKNERSGQFAYQGGQYNPAMSAEAILCFQYLDHLRDSETLVQGTVYLQKNLPRQGHETSYYWYYGTQAMFHLQGEPWKQWNQAIHPLMIETQRKEGEMAGTWDPKDQWENSGGRIYATSLRLLMLEVYYRHLPIYQTLR